MGLVHEIALTLIKGIGPKLSKQLLLHFGTAEAVFSAKADELRRVEGIGQKIIGRLQQHKTAALGEAELHVKYISDNNIEVLTYTNHRYPKRLKNCYDAPLILYFKGNADLNHKRVVSIVGTRNATSYGQQLCKQLIELLAKYNVLVLSGLAYGIDAAIHRECVALNVPTVGILGHGLDLIYPPSHRNLAQKMLTGGGLLTEFLPGTSPDRENFPKRNRIVAGAADVTIVIEASIKGGALITAELANSYNRDVYAFPGRTTDVFSEGCNFLIKTNRAALINHPQDLIYYLGWDDDRQVKPKQLQAQLAFDLDENELLIITALDKEPVGVDELSLICKLSQSKLAGLLLSLEMRGVVISLPGKIFKKA